MTVTAHQIDTALASEWNLVGKPLTRTINGSLFVQRSWMRGRPWLRFLKKLDAPGWWVTAYPTRRLALHS